jgi:hypothetical protein
LKTNTIDFFAPFQRNKLTDAWSACCDSMCWKCQSISGIIWYLFFSSSNRIFLSSMCFLVSKQFGRKKHFDDYGYLLLFFNVCFFFDLG